MYKILLLISISLLSCLANALQLMPSSYELAPSGSLSQHVFEVTNDSKEIIAVQASVLTREWLSEQKEENNKVEEFDIFPPQMILKPGEKKGLRVHWKGKKTFKKEKSFRLLVKQLPVNFTKDQKKSAMKTLHQVVGALYVTPPAAKADLVIKNHKKASLIVNEKTKKKSNFLLFDVINVGSKHVLLSKAGLVAKGEKTLILTAEHFKTLPTQNVLPGATLKVRLPWPNELGQSISSISQP